MRVGIVILPDLPWAQQRELWVRAEQYGFDHAWTYDHLAWRSLADGPWFASVPTLAAAALVTSTLRLGTFVASPNFRHPVPFAKEVMTLDDISNGRLVLGLGAGGLGFDAAVLGDQALEPRERAGRLEEFVGLLDELLTSPTTTIRGERYSAVDARMIPGCVQQPRVPFVVAASGPRLLRLVARHGQGWVTIGAAEGTGGADGVAAWWEGVRVLSARLDDSMTEAGRDPLDIARYLSLDASGVVALGSLEYYRDCVGRADELGFTDVVIHWPRERGVYAADERVLEQVAASELG